MNAAVLERMGRHVLLPEIGETGQDQIRNATVMIIGCGGLGNAVIAYLAASGVHNLLIADFDVVDQGHLQRQILFSQQDVRKAKADVVEAKLMQQYPDIVITPIRQKLNLERLLQCLKSCDVLIDCSNKEETRLLLNEAAKRSQTPFITAAASGFQAQMAVFDFRNIESPCYQCLAENQHFTEVDAKHYTVLSPVAGVIGSMQAQEALRMLTGFGDSTAGLLIHYDALTLKLISQAIPAQNSCQASHI